MTSRAAILGLVACAMVLTLAFPLKELLAQRSEIAQLHAQQRSTTSKITADRHAIALWNDPAYVRTQATQRLQYVQPGDTAYVVVGRAASGAVQAGPDARTVTPRKETKNSPWYSQLWSTVRVADGE